MAFPNGTVALPNGTVALPNGSVVFPDGSVALPDDRGAFLDDRGRLQNGKNTLKMTKICIGAGRMPLSPAGWQKIYRGCRAEDGGCESAGQNGSRLFSGTGIGRKKEPSNHRFAFRRK